MNEKMVGYIRKYLNQGHPLNQIRQALLSQGYPDKEIKESALIAMQGEIKKIKSSNIQIYIAIGVVVVLLLGMGGYFLIGITLSPVKIDPPENQTILNNTQTNNTIPISGSTICDMNCLVQASAICEPKSTNYNASLDFFGIQINTETFYEIRSGEKCQLYMRTEDYWVDITEETRQYLLSEGVSEAEIELQIVEMEAYKFEIIGKDAICTFDTLDKMQEYLQKINTGTFSGGVSCEMVGDGCTINETTSTCEGETWNCTSSGDATLGNCEGTMFLPSPVGNINS